MSSRPRIGIIGASGYGGGELMRLLARAPEVEVAVLVSETYAGQDVRSAFPGLRASFPAFEHFDSARLQERTDIVVMAQGNGIAMKLVPDLLAAGKRVIDLSADFRLKDASLYPTWYKLEHACPDLLSSAVYGLPELHREEVRKASLVGNPGCYTTASILALAPLLEHKLIDPKTVVIDAKSGVSGAGRSKADTAYLFSEANESVRAYGVAGSHRHTPEIEQELSFALGENLKVSFTPHLIPMTRGILASCYANLVSPKGEAELVDLYRARFQGHPFVVVLEPGQLPSTKATLGSNEVHIGIAVDPRTGRVSVFSALDNLVKGAAGQAIQNLNLMLDLPETHGLEGGGLWP